MNKPDDHPNEELHQVILGHEKLVSFLGHWPTFNDGHIESVFIESASGREGPIITIVFYLDDVQAAMQGKIHQLETTLRWYEATSFKRLHKRNLMPLMDDCLAHFEIIHHRDMIETILHTQMGGAYRIRAKRIEVIEVC